VGFNEDANVMLESANFGFDYTPYLKIKLTRDLVKGKAALELILRQSISRGADFRVLQLPTLLIISSLMPVFSLPGFN